MDKYSEIKDAIRKPWISLFMDGRNEHGTHLLPVPPDGLCFDEKATENLLYSENEDVESVFKEAEDLGFTVGCCIVVTCNIGQDEYYELSKVDTVLTQLIFGSKDEQMRELDEMIAKSTT